MAVLDYDIGANVILERFRKAIGIEHWTYRLEWDEQHKGWRYGAWDEKDKENKFVGIFLSPQMMKSPAFEDELEAVFRHLHNQAQEIEKGKRWLNE